MKASSLCAGVIRTYFTGKSGQKTSKLNKKWQEVTIRGSPRQIGPLADQIVEEPDTAGRTLAWKIETAPDRFDAKISSMIRAVKRISRYGIGGGLFQTNAVVKPLD